MNLNNKQILSTTESVCPECLARIPAWRVMINNNIYLEKKCPKHGEFRVIVWRGIPAYESWIRPKIPSIPLNPYTLVEKGCPFDCGLCPDHRQHTCTALLEVTQRCDLGCKFCFANSGASHSPDPGLDVIEGWYRRVLDAGGPYNIQLSGGEPCLRDDLPDIVALGRSMGFDFIQVNTNGLRFARDKGFLKRLCDSGLASVFMQFDGTEDRIHKSLRGRELLSSKIAAIENCAEQNLGVVLVPTLVQNINTHNIGAMVLFARDWSPAVRGIHFQPASYFGRYPQAPDDGDRITIPEVICAIEAQTGELVSRQAFKPSGCENATCSFHGNFIVMADGSLKSWTRHQELNSCCCKPEKADEGAARTREFTARYWSHPPSLDIPVINNIEPGLGGWDEFLVRAQTHALTISGMAFQDAWTLDLERLRDCCIHTVSPDGRIIPFCAFNLTGVHGKSLYRRG